MARGSRALALALAASLLALVPAAPTSSAPAPPRAEVRVDQHGWLPHETKTATLMASRPLRHTTFAVVDRHHRVVLRGTLPSTPDGTWSRRFPALYRLDLSALHRKGRYTVRTQGALRVVSPQF